MQQSLKIPVVCPRNMIEKFGWNQLRCFNEDVKISHVMCKKGPIVLSRYLRDNTQFIRLPVVSPVVMMLRISSAIF